MLQGHVNCESNNIELSSASPQLHAMILAVLYLWCYVVYIADAQNTSDQPLTGSGFQYTYMNGTNVMNITEVCKNTCVVKCCPPTQILIYNESNDILICNSTDVTPDDWKLDIYDMNSKQKLMKSERKLEEFTHVYSDQFLQHTMPVEFIYPPPRHTIYILEDGSFIIRQPNYFNQWPLKSLLGEFCLDRRVLVAANGNVTREWAIHIIADNTEEPDSDNKATYTAYGMLVSCVFLVLVLGVYALLPQLRNLAGMMLMAYVATLTTAFVFRAVQVISTDNQMLDRNACLAVGFIMYYAILASFTWLNVMSFDIWWSMRGFREMQRMPRHGALVKFAWYGLYGWGAPLIAVLFMLIVDPMDLTDLPNFIKPHIMDPDICFMEEAERQLYMNGPILIATCINITLFLMTAYNIWRIKSDVFKHNAGESRRNNKEKNRFCIYLKLSLVMGVNWILEVVGSVYKTDSPLWYVPDIFNCLVGLFIFIIFICKKHIIVLLCKRFSTRKAIINILQPVDSTHTLSSRLNKDGK